ncbi:MAG: hypothetical protein K6T37_05395 [Acidothermus cellulolyticus]|nr:hypothetical protein [Acidothermus cellulolyticus]
MMSSSSRPATVLRGAAAVRPARLDSDLLAAAQSGLRRADPRLVDPELARAFAAAVQEAREQARRDGYADGYADGERAAHADAEHVLEQRVAAVSAQLAERRRDLEQAISALEQARAEFAARQVTELAGLEDIIVRHAYRLAETLLGRELALADAPVLEAVRRALVILPADVPAIVRCHPDDLAVIHSSSALTASHRLVIEADPTVERGSCVVDAGATHVDASLDRALARVRRVLGLETEESAS